MGDSASKDTTPSEVCVARVVVDVERDDTSLVKWLAKEEESGHPKAPPPSPTSSQSTAPSASPGPALDSENDTRCFCLVERVFVAFWGLPGLKMPTRTPLMGTSPYFDSHNIVVGACTLARSEVLGTARLSAMSIAACLVISIKQALGQRVDHDRSVLCGVSVERVVGSMFHDALAWAGSSKTSLSPASAKQLAINIVGIEVDLMRSAPIFEHLERSVSQQAELLLWETKDRWNHSVSSLGCLSTTRRRRGAGDPVARAHCVVLFYWRSCFLSGHSGLVCAGDESARALACLAIAAVTGRAVSESERVVGLAHRVCDVAWKLTSDPSRYGSASTATFESLLDISLSPRVAEHVVVAQSRTRSATCGWGGRRKRA